MFCQDPCLILQGLDPDFMPILILEPFLGDYLTPDSYQLYLPLGGLGPLYKAWAIDYCVV